MAPYLNPRVTFLLTEDPSRTGGVKTGTGRKRRESLSPDRFSIYTNLSAISGGLTVFSTDKEIQDVSVLIQDNTVSAGVTLLHIEKDSPSLASSYIFYVDPAVKNIIIHISGELMDFTIYDPSGTIDLEFILHTRLLNVGAETVLSFVIDTTGSMFDEISAARERAYSIILERRGTIHQPSQYVLVPFHDPDVGPLYRTTDPDQFIDLLGSLSALGGGDEPEMCLTALQIMSLAWNSHTHQSITEEALLLITRDLFQETPNLQGRTLDPQLFQGSFTASELFKAYYGSQETVSTKQYQQAVSEIVQANAAMDFLSSTRSDPQLHFDSERLKEASAMLQSIRHLAVQSLQAGDESGARHRLGSLLHSLQDFYSHSNWVEMGYRKIHSTLLGNAEEIGPVTPENMQTCRDCDHWTCNDNILEKINKKKLLTSGYYNNDPPKPPGKCSHGGLFDQSRYQSARGGINKDSTSLLFSPHHYLHDEAAHLATMATISVLQDLRDTGIVCFEQVPSLSSVHGLFSRLLNVGAETVLSFVIDTTGSMFDEISAARERAYSIILERRGTIHQPSQYVLVPFHDPDVGPLYRTTDPDQFIDLLGSLSALGGGDEPEMCLTALQLALVNTPPLSEIFVFTDASPKDKHLQNAVEALILHKRSKVTFLLTEDPSRTGGVKTGTGRKRRESLSPDRFSIYTNLSAISGGLTVFSTDKEIQDVSVLIQDNTVSAGVTLLHIEKDSPSLASSYIFYVDPAVKNIIIHISGELMDFMIYDPSGESQYLFKKRGDLAVIECFVGFCRVSLLSPTPGEWRIKIVNRGTIRVNVLGQSTIDFLYHFAVPANGSHPGLSRLEGRPASGVPTFLVLAVTGLSTDSAVTFSHVTLLGANGESLERVTLNATDTGGEFIGEVATLPSQPFSVKMTGNDNEGNIIERASAELNHVAQVLIQVPTAPPLYPGKSAHLWVNISNSGATREFVVMVTDDRKFVKSWTPDRLSVARNRTSQVQIDLTTPVGAELGSVVSVCVTVEAADRSDLNFAVLHLSHNMCIVAGHTVVVCSLLSRNNQRKIVTGQLISIHCGALTVLLVLHRNTGVFKRQESIPVSPNRSTDV
ncbi:von Willebrand factor A domain-containing protein 7 [Acipenser ruthenus]|uniref:von Willebrand factor A domain-containing protein 7 n=1 Tax=Acipenser ruthenus TaxID=7906 RepID=A0A444UC87_ACIRT|nr:von Willebrand factor A domain-containing protein 7 [Acipenser ruthenus]